MLASVESIRVQKSVPLVLAVGVFDRFHIGHLTHLQSASKLGRLVVGVTMDAFVGKGPGRPHDNENDRAEMVKALSCVSEVLLVENSFHALKAVKPSILAKGTEYIGRLLEADYCREHGIKVYFTSPRPEIHTSDRR